VRGTAVAEGMVRSRSGSESGSMSESESESRFGIEVGVEVEVEGEDEAKVSALDVLSRWLVDVGVDVDAAKYP